MQADLFDAITQNTQVTLAAAGGKPPKVKPYPRPKETPESEEKKPITVADLFKQFSVGKH